MNIDIVNKQVSKKLSVPEKQVALINKFFWRQVYDHFYSYSDRPLDIQNVCVFYDDKWLIKKHIKKYIIRIRKTKVSKRFAEQSLVRESLIENYKKILRQLLKLRKLNKYTN